MSIRRATPADIEALVGLMDEVHDLHVAHLPWVFRPALQREMLAYFDELLDSPEARVYLACAGEEAVGYLLLLILDQPAAPMMERRRSLYIESIGVTVRHRGQGYGRALLETARAVAGELGLVRIELDTWGFNEPAHAFFRRHGFGTMCVRMVAEV